MNKRFLTVVAVALLMTLTACSTSPENTAETTTGGIEQKASEATTESLTEVVKNSVDFPATITLEDVSMLTETLGLNLDDIEEFTVTQQMLSVDVVEIIIAKPKESKMNAVLETLEKRKEAIKTTYAFYPEQVEAADATVVGSKGAYAYLICHKDATVAETALLSAIG